MPGFKGERIQFDLYASDLMGHQLYARRVTAENNSTDGQSARNSERTHDMALINRADRDDMDNIGEIKFGMVNTPSDASEYRSTTARRVHLRPIRQNNW